MGTVEVTKHPTLFKRTSAGKVQIWYIESGGANFRTVSGQKDGAKVVSEFTTCKAKNVGRANATTAEEQCELEVAALYKKKLAQGGYHESEDQIDNAKFIKPMLAEKYDPSLVQWSATWSQPKLDGVRCLATADGLFSRQGKLIPSCPHIERALAPYFKLNPTMVLDGELYADKLSDDFNEIISLVRKQKPSSAHFAKTEESIQYHVYDMVSPSNFGVRIANLILEVDMIGSPHLKVVPTSPVEAYGDLDLLYGRYLEQGYEGQMVRVGLAGYEHKRSKQLLKRKEFVDAEFTVVDIEEGIGNRSGMAGRITYALEDGRTFGSGIRGGFGFYKEIFENKALYIGGEGTVRYQALTPEGIPRFPVTIALYPDGRDL